MEILRGIDARPDLARPAVVTIGAFAVVHRGHRALVERVVAEARSRVAVPAVITFDPHPMDVLAPDRAPCRLATLDQRLERFQELGVEWLLLVEFNARVASLSPEDFVRQALVETLRATKVVVGVDFRFGYQRAGDVTVLESLGDGYGFEVEPFALVAEGGSSKISTSEVRRLVQDGHVEEAAALLGDNHRIAGKVVAGDGQGRGMGFPTANLQPPERICLPAAGIYTGWWVESSRRLPGVVYVGDKPTLSGRGTGIEIHVLDLDEDLYGRKGEIELGQRLRADKAFPSVDELITQMRADVAEARRRLLGAGTGP